MREILFRAKTTDTNKWVYGSYFKEKNGTSWIYDNKEDYFYLVNDETAGQYIGLECYVPLSDAFQICDLPRKKQKIFEGDILKGFSYDENLLGIVRWDEEEAGFYIEAIDDFYDVVDAIPEEIEVVGNAWDNPELLKKIDMEE